MGKAGFTEQVSAPGACRISVTWYFWPHPFTGRLIEGRSACLLPGRTTDAKQEKQEEYVRLVEYIRASVWHKRTSRVPGSLQDLALGV